MRDPLMFDTVEMPLFLWEAYVLTENQEEFDAACTAHFLLAAIVEEHNKEARDAKEAHDPTDEFLWGQDFDYEPEVWDTLDELWGDNSHPIDPRDLPDM